LCSHGRTSRQYVKGSTPPQYGNNRAFSFSSSSQALKYVDACIYSEAILFRFIQDVPSRTMCSYMNARTFGSTQQPRWKTRFKGLIEIPRSSSRNQENHDTARLLCSPSPWSDSPSCFPFLALVNARKCLVRFLE